jgi:hypothetical protein
MNSWAIACWKVIPGVANRVFLSSSQQRALDREIGVTQLDEDKIIVHLMGPCLGGSASLVATVEPDDRI